MGDSTKYLDRQLTKDQLYCALNFGVIPSTASITTAKRDIKEFLREDGARAEACAMERLEERLQRTTGKDGRPDASRYFDETFRRTLEYERKQYPFDHLSARNSFVLFESGIEYELTHYPDHFAPIYGSTADMLDPGSRPEWLTFEILWKFQEKLLGALREWFKRAPNPVIGAAINKITAAREKFRFIEQEAQSGNAENAVPPPAVDQGEQQATPVAESPKTCLWPELSMSISIDSDWIEYSIGKTPSKKCNSEVLGLTPSDFKTLQGLAVAGGDGNQGRTLDEKQRQKYSRLNKKLCAYFTNMAGRAIDEGKATFKISKLKTEDEDELTRLIREQNQDRWSDGSLT